jgi:hypothetical protein
MSRPSGPRKTTNLSESVHYRLNLYALAASAAGVGVLTSPPVSEAKIVYTPAHVLLHGIEGYPLDLNNDGHADFSFASVNGCTEGLCFATFIVGAASVTGNSHNGVWAKGRSYALALQPGANIGPRKEFVKNGTMLRINTFDSSEKGYWRNVKNRYLGLKFRIKGRTHFGWARLSVHNQGNKITSILTGYAYETIAGKPIVAGQTKDTTGNPANEDSGPDASLTNAIPGKSRPTTLGALAMGAPGLSIWQRKEVGRGYAEMNN